MSLREAAPDVGEDEISPVDVVKIGVVIVAEKKADVV